MDQFTREYEGVMLYELGLVAGVHSFSSHPKLAILTRILWHVFIDLVFAPAGVLNIVD